MHTTEITIRGDYTTHKEWVCHHNGDYSGEVIIIVPVDCIRKIKNVHDKSIYEVEIPFDVLAELVGRAVIDEQISKLEQQSGMDKLKLRQRS